MVSATGGADAYQCGCSDLHQSRSAGFGVVIRDHQGNVRAANRGGINCDLNPEVAEALALR
jgi:hypothetical protein